MQIVYLSMLGVNSLSVIRIHLQFKEKEQIAEIPTIGYILKLMVSIWLQNWMDIELMEPCPPSVSSFETLLKFDVFFHFPSPGLQSCKDVFANELYLLIKYSKLLWLYQETVSQCTRVSAKFCFGK